MVGAAGGGPVHAAMCHRTLRRGVPASVRCTARVATSVARIVPTASRRASGTVMRAPWRRMLTVCQRCAVARVGAGRRRRPATSSHNQRGVPDPNAVSFCPLRPKQRSKRRCPGACSRFLRATSARRQTPSDVIVSRARLPQVRPPRSCGPNPPPTDRKSALPETAGDGDHPTPPFGV